MDEGASQKGLLGGLAGIMLSFRAVGGNGVEVPGKNPKVPRHAGFPRGDPLHWQVDSLPLSHLGK